MARWSLLPVLLLACGGRDPVAPELPPGPTDLGEADRPVVVRAAPPPDTSPTEAAAEVDVDALYPLLSAVGPVGGAPEAVVLDLARPAWIDEPVPADAEGVTARVTPTWPITARWDDPRTLRLIPDRPFEPGVTYTVTVETLPTEAGPWTPSPSPTVTFTPPALAVHDVVFAELTPDDTHLIDVRFTGPVTRDGLSGTVAVRGPSGPVQGVRLVDAGRTDTVRLAVPAKGLRPGAALTVAIGAGVRHATADARAPGATRVLVVPPEAPAMRVLDARLREGASGWVVDVVCDDDAVEGWNRYTWDRTADQGWWVSQRCELSADAVSTALSLSSGAPGSVVPSSTGFRLDRALGRGRIGLRLEAGATTVDGGVLLKPVELELVVPPRSPTLRFAQQGRYLPKAGWESLAVRHRNVGVADLQIRHVPRNNLVFWLTGEEEQAGERTSDLVGRTRVALRSDLDEELETWIDIRGLVPEARQGVYQVELSAGEVDDTLRVLVTDLELIAKGERSEDGRRAVHAWVLDVHDHTPRPGATVELLRASGKVLGTCRTDASGHCHLVAQSDLDDAEPVALVAEHQGDLTLLGFEDVRIRPSEQDVAGRSWRQTSAFTASAWTDRGVYRPGEVVHVAGVIRDAAVQAPSTTLPVRLDVQDPRGRVWKRQVVQPDEVGLIAVDVPLPDAALTGTYQVTWTVADEVVAQRSFAVETFVPERMEVTAALRATDLLAGEDAVVDISARYLFGGSAAGSRVDVTCRVVPTTFRPTRHAEWTYGEADEGALLDLGSATGVLSADGSLALPCPPPPPGARPPDTGRLEVDVAVFEAGSGRTTRARATATVHASRIHVGLRAPTEPAEIDAPLVVQGVIVDWAGDVVTDATEEVALRLSRLESEWDWSWDEDSGEESYRRHLRSVAEGEQTVTVTKGRFEATFVPRQAGDAIVVGASTGAARSSLQRTLAGPRWWWSDSADTDRTPRPLQPALVPLTLPDVARVGEAVPVTFDAPFPGRALVTVETDRVQHHAWLDVAAGRQTWRFTLDGFVSDVYVAVLVLKDPHAESAAGWLPDRAWGVARLPVEPEAHTLDVRLVAPKQVRSNSPLVLDVDVGDAAGTTHLVVAAVDEGVLSLTGFQSPDPLPDLFPRHALEVDTYETTGWTLARPPGGPSSRTGGDADGAPARVTAVEPVALWSGVVATDAAGHARVTLDVPSYRGALRVMVVAASRTRTGHADARVLVRDPIVVQTTLPRFLVQGDRAEIPVFLTNVSGARQEVAVRLSSEAVPMGGFAPAPDAPLSFEGESQGTVALDDGASATLVFRVRAPLALGAARLTVEASTGTSTALESLVVPLQPVAPQVRRTQRVPLSDGTLTLSSLLTGWTPTTEQTTVWVTANPYADALGHLTALVRYPWGCIEQTTSSTRPLLYLSDLVPGLLPEVSGRTDLDARIRHGLDRVLSMQTARGGFAYWPGGTEPVLWGTAYATHLLLDARDAGHAVPAHAIEDALRWMEGQVDELARGASGLAVSDPHGAVGGEAYVHYVLARAGNPRRARATTLLGRLAGDTDPAAQEARYLLSAALFLAGDHRLGDALRDLPTRGLTGARRNDGTYWSDLRARGLMLSVFEDTVGPEAPERGEALAQIVAEGLRQRSSAAYTTQELVWGVTALGKRVHGAAQQADVRLTEAGRQLPVDSVAGLASGPRWTLSRASERPSLSLSVQGVGSARLYALIDSQGVRSDAPGRTGHEGITLTRRFVDAAGEDLDPGSLSLGDVVYSVLTLRNPTNAPMPNLAVVDRYPAGWEVENPRLGRASSLPWMEGMALWDADYLDLRDDRVAGFGTLAAGQEVSMVVALRAVTVGTFALPPAEVEAMYDPSVWAREAAGTAIVRGDWERFWL